MMSFHRFCRLSGSCGPLEFEATFPPPRSSLQIKFTPLGIRVCVCVCIAEQALCPRKFEYKIVHVIRTARPEGWRNFVSWARIEFILLELGAEGKERKFYCDIERRKLLRIIVFSRLRSLLLGLVSFQLASTRFDSSVFVSGLMSH